ncbi:FAD/NAD(P)-binding domain-containing protein [Westerdykella ornata]|uniref:FAD/NAD(P)-binding domain-containing protein n=1 Tax=Westerdykella ornata TaxID=318751 RepID=A0A6A6JLI9_WESOR|nr:FAD/NAD(P)-binding domain-containing protein [Westerdykella ornata]KAF2277372.1 FAD/NAD(P)-binding domain-containing protein [Westerdykella ornata]
MGSMAVPSKDRVEPGSVNIPPFTNFPTATSNPDTIDATRVAEDLIRTFNTALEGKNYTTISDLFLEDNGFWRDHLALTWELRTLQGRGKILECLKSSKHPLTRIEINTSAAHNKPHVEPIDASDDVNGVQFFIQFETDIGRGEGVVRLAEDNGNWRIFTLFTVLKELKGFEEPVGKRRTKGVQHGGNPDRKNWKETRDAEANFEGKDPTVLIIGAGQGGLTVAARLKMLSVPALMIDCNERVGDNWRKRYHQLVLHDAVWYDHMPYILFPPHWPVFTPKDKLAEFFEAYVKLLELNVWTSTELKSTSWDESKKIWTVTVERRKLDGTTETRTLHPRHIIQATGHSGKKNLPDIEGMQDFRGDRLCHSSEFPGASPNAKGKKAVVVGSCNSGHDIAQDFYEKGYDVTMVQRSTTCVISSESIVELGLKGLYEEDGPPVEDADVLNWSWPSSVFKAKQMKLTQRQHEHDKETLEGLRKAGFRLDSGPNDAGLMMKYYQRGGGYYIDVGASQLIIDGKIKIKQGQEISKILPDGIEFADGSRLQADEIVFATGYQNMRTQARLIFGDDVADRVGDVWGLNDEGEFRTIWQRTGHPGFWFMGGNLAMSRYMSRILALQIKAQEEGIL